MIFFKGKVLEGQSLVKPVLWAPGILPIGGWELLSNNCPAHTGLLQSSECFSLPPPEWKSFFCLYFNKFKAEEK